MSDPTDEQLAAWLAGDLDEAAAKAVSEAVGIDAGTAARADAIAAVLGGLAVAGSPAAPAGLAAVVEASVLASIARDGGGAAAAARPGAGPRSPLGRSDASRPPGSSTGGPLTRRLQRTGSMMAVLLLVVVVGGVALRTLRSGPDSVFPDEPAVPELSTTQPSQPAFPAAPSAGNTGPDPGASVPEAAPPAPSSPAPDSPASPVDLAPAPAAPEPAAQPGPSAPPTDLDEPLAPEPPHPTGHGTLAPTTPTPESGAGAVDGDDDPPDESAPPAPAPVDDGDDAAPPEPAGPRPDNPAAGGEHGGEDRPEGGPAPEADDAPAADAEEAGDAGDGQGEADGASGPTIADSMAELPTDDDVRAYFGGRRETHRLLGTPEEEAAGLAEEYRAAVEVAMPFGSGATPAQCLDQALAGAAPAVVAAVESVVHDGRSALAYLVVRGTPLLDAADVVVAAVDACDVLVAAPVTT